MDIGFKELTENGLFNAFLGGLGGAARIATGLTQRESLALEAFRIIVIAMPIAWVGGGFAEELGATEYTIRSVSFFSGLLAHNIAKVVMDLGFMEVLKLLLGGKK